MIAFLLPADAQSMRNRLPPEDPRWLKLQVTGASLGVYSEGVFEQSQFNGSSSVDYSRIFIGPTLGLTMQGSIYHPNFARFNLNGESAFGFGYEEINSTTTSHRSRYEQLGNFQSVIYLLSPKPYASTLTASYDHTYRDYDFFTRTTVDTWRYGVQTGYRDGPIPFAIMFDHRDESEEHVVSFNTVTNISGGGSTNVSTHPVFGTSSLRQDTVTFSAHNERELGATRFTYSLSDYTRKGFDGESGATDHTFGLADMENFGARKQVLWNNDVGLALRRFTDAPSDDFNANSHLTIDHTTTVSTAYDANYFRNTFGPNESDNYNASAAVRHQLYESLASTLKVDGQSYNFSGEDGSAVTTRYGVSLSEGYTKRVGTDSRLTINGTLGYGHTDVEQDATLIHVIDERHTFPTGAGGSPVDTFFLNQPNVFESTIVITDETRTLTYLEGLDYSLSVNGLLTMVRRVGGSRIPSGGLVLISYDAVPTPSGSYDTINGLLHARFDFKNGLLGIFGRMNSIQNHGTPGLIVQDVSAFAIGADTSWQFLRAGVEFEVYDSSFSSYRAARMFQSLAFQLDNVSSLNLDFNETWTDYVDANRQEESFLFTTRYQRRINRYLRTNLDGGVSLRYGPGVDETIATFRPGMEFAMGRLSVKAGYDFEYRRFLDSEERIKHMFFVRMKRTF